MIMLSFKYFEDEDYANFGICVDFEHWKYFVVFYQRTGVSVC